MDDQKSEKLAMLGETADRLKCLMGLETDETVVEFKKLVDKNLKYLNDYEDVRIALAGWMAFVEVRMERLAKEVMSIDLEAYHSKAQQAARDLENMSGTFSAIFSQLERVNKRLDAVEK